MYSQDNTENKVSISSFKRILQEDYNIGIHVPKKRWCQKCERYKNLPVILKTGKEEETYLNHIEEKDKAKYCFVKKQKDEDPTSVVVSFDLQKVLATLHGTSMLLGFSRKYAWYNYTKVGLRMVFVISGGKKQEERSALSYSDTYLN